MDGATFKSIVKQKNSTLSVLTEKGDKWWDARADCLTSKAKELSVTIPIEELAVSKTSMDALSAKNQTGHAVFVQRVLNKEAGQHIPFPHGNGERASSGTGTRSVSKITFSDADNKQFQDVLGVALVENKMAGFLTAVSKWGNKKLAEYSKLDPKTVKENEQVWKALETLVGQGNQSAQYYMLKAYMKTTVEVPNKSGLEIIAMLNDASQSVWAMALRLHGYQAFGLEEPKTEPTAETETEPTPKASFE